nr:MAG TPA: hypothetical protein [Caudoviricetes sp.]
MDDGFMRLFGQLTEQQKNTIIESAKCMAQGNKNDGLYKEGKRNAETAAGGEEKTRA